MRFVRDPATGKRVSRVNPEAAWVRADVPDDELSMTHYGSGSRRGSASSGRLPEPTNLIVRASGKPAGSPTSLMQRSFAEPAVAR